MKKKLLIMILIMSIAFIMISVYAIKKSPLNIIQEQKFNVYEGQLGNLPVRMMIYRNGSKLKAYYIGKDDKPEQILTGTCHSIMHKFELENDDHTVSLAGFAYQDTENHNLIVLKGSFHRKTKKASEPFYLTPVWYIDGSDRENLYSKLGFDTKQVEEFTDSVLEWIRRDDSYALSQFVIYPFVVYGNGNQMTIHNEQEFQLKFHDIMPEDFKNAVVQDFRRYLFANYMGIQFGNQNGFWFRQDGDTKILKIQSIFNTNDNYKEEPPSDNDQRIEKG